MADLPKGPRRERFCMVLTAAERAKLDYLAEKKTCSAATLLRAFIEREYDAEMLRTTTAQTNAALYGPSK